MPYYDYVCGKCGLAFDKFFRSIADGEKHINATACDRCNYMAGRVPSVPFPAHFYGEPGHWSKPSALKRHSTKLASAEGNDKT